MAPLSTSCVQHHDRAGYAVCMSCRAVLCQECATTFDGINFCRPCLDQRRGVAGTASSWPRRLGHAATALVLVLMLIACVRLMAWISTVLAGWK